MRPILYLVVAMDTILARVYPLIVETPITKVRIITYGKIYDRMNQYGNTQVDVV